MAVCGGKVKGDGYYEMIRGHSFYFRVITE